jgi:hypothetical protein
MLRIDADGSVMCCNDIRGNVSDKYSVFDLPNETAYEEFQKEWCNDSKRCPGCLWPDLYQSELNRKLGIQEFEYSQNGECNVGTHDRKQ